MWGTLGRSYFCLLFGSGAGGVVGAALEQGTRALGSDEFLQGGRIHELTLVLS